MKNAKGLLIEICIIILCIALLIFMINNEEGMDLLLFKVYSTSALDEKKEELNTKVESLDLTRTNHKNALNNLESAKSNYEKEKNRYDAISDETISIINQATKGTTYNLEYIWVNLGNYALANNLSISLYEPGATIVTTDDDTSNTTKATGSTSTQISDTVSLETLKIMVKGTYLNVSEFIYNVENDKELRFNLDNIRMEYAENNKISAIFEVTGLELKK
ncbi:MAG: hypothetical protein IJ809_00690 [Clostridia bacterium]|nr:hypothetical protein [Clostridia bacterium]